MKRTHVQMERKWAERDRRDAIEEVVFWCSHVPAFLLVMALGGLALAVVVAVTAGP